MKTLKTLTSNRTFLIIHAIVVTLIFAFSPLQGSAHLVDEGEIMVESWMTSPFESVAAEDELVVEEWMTAPFESVAAEDELVLEEWMTTPWV